MVPVDASSRLAYLFLYMILCLPYSLVLLSYLHFHQSYLVVEGLLLLLVLIECSLESLLGFWAGVFVVLGHLWDLGEVRVVVDVDVGAGVGHLWLVVEAWSCELSRMGLRIWCSGICGFGVGAEFLWLKLRLFDSVLRLWNNWVYLHPNLRRIDVRSSPNLHTFVNFVIWEIKELWLRIESLEVLRTMATTVYLWYFTSSLWLEWLIYLVLILSWIFQNALSEIAVAFLVPDSISLLSLWRKIRPLWPRRWHLRPMNFISSSYHFEIPTLLEIGFLQLSVRLVRFEPIMIKWFVVVSKISHLWLNLIVLKLMWIYAHLLSFLGASLLFDIQFQVKHFPYFLIWSRFANWGSFRHDLRNVTVWNLRFWMFFLYCSFIQSECFWILFICLIWDEIEIWFLALFDTIIYQFVYYGNPSSILVLLSKFTVVQESYVKHRWLLAIDLFFSWQISVHGRRFSIDFHLWDVVARMLIFRVSIWFWPAFRLRHLDKLHLILYLIKSLLLPRIPLRCNIWLSLQNHIRRISMQINNLKPIIPFLFKQRHHLTISLPIILINLLIQILIFKQAIFEVLLVKMLRWNWLFVFRSHLWCLIGISNLGLEYLLDAFLFLLGWSLLWSIAISWCTLSWCASALLAYLVCDLFDEVLFALFIWRVWRMASVFGWEGSLICQLSVWVLVWLSGPDIWQVGHIEAILVDNDVVSSCNLRCPLRKLWVSSIQEWVPIWIWISPPSFIIQHVMVVLHFLLDLLLIFPRSIGFEQIGLKHHFFYFNILDYFQI